MKVRRGAKPLGLEEFYVDLNDVSREMVFHRKHFKGRTVFLTVSDPENCDILKYFFLSFESLGIKKLIVVCCDDFSSGVFCESYKIEINEVFDITGDGRIDMDDFFAIVSEQPGAYTTLKIQGGFHCEQMGEFLDASDIIVMSAPSKELSHYLGQLQLCRKPFIVLSDRTRVLEPRIFSDFQAGRLRFGRTSPTGVYNPTGFHYDFAARKYVRVMNRTTRTSVGWYTNFPTHYTPEPMSVAHNKMSEGPCQFYDEYEILDVPSSRDIPYDYQGVMAVPVDFLYEYSSEQFELFGTTRIFNDVMKKAYKGKMKIRDGSPCKMRLGREIMPEKVLIKHKWKYDASGLPVLAGDFEAETVDL